MKRKSFFLLYFFSFLSFSNYGWGQQQWWNKISPAQQRSINDPAITILNQVEIKEAVLKSILFKLEDSASSPSTTIAIPTSNGQIQTFQIRKNKLLDHNFEKRYPFIRSYSGHAIDQPDIQIRMEIGPHGWHVMYGNDEEIIFIDPIDPQNHRLYNIYKASRQASSFLCEAPSLLKRQNKIPLKLRSKTPDVPILRSYRIAVASMYSFTRDNGGNKAGATGMIVSLLNRANFVLERDLGISVVLASLNDKLIETNPNSEEPENKTAYINRLIGASNYDLGHFFLSAGSSSGYASLASACGLNKANARTIMSAPFLSSPRNLNVFLHELGHQFGANHSFNGNVGTCGNNRERNSAFEPGAGTTIMSYAGNCTTDNVVMGIGDNYFHGGSIAEIYGNLESIVGTCAEENVLEGVDIEVQLPKNGQVLPVYTPIELEAFVDGVNLNKYLFNWEQVDIGGPASLGKYGSGNAALFRSYPPNLSTRQSFPSISALLNPSSNPGELLPKKERLLSFQFTIFPLEQSKQTVFWEKVIFTISAQAGPFEVADINSLNLGAYNLIEWEVANTDQAPILEDSVIISLSTDDINFDYELARTTNDGAAWVYVPNDINASTARIKVKAQRSYFYNLSKRPSLVKFPDLLESRPFATLLNPEQNFICLNDTAEIIGIVNHNSIANRPIPKLEAFAKGVETVIDFFDEEAGFFKIQLHNQGDALPPDLDTLKLALSYDDYVDTLYFPIQIMSDDISFQPQLSGPLEAATEVSWTPRFRWQAHPFIDSFILQVAQDPDFSLLHSEIALKSKTKYQLEDFLEPSSIYYWRIIGIQEACGIFIASPTRSFETESIRCEQFTPEDLPALFTPDGMEESLIKVNNSLFIYDLNILDIKGTYPTPQSEILFQLSSPSGTSIDLFLKSDTCTQSKAFHFSLDDEAALDQPTCPHNEQQIIRPIDPLSTFAEEEVFGLWTLSSVRGGKGGQLDNWTLEICYGANTLLTNTADLSIPIKEQVKVYPNPAQSIVQFELEQTGNYHLFIHDTMGRLCFQQDKIANKTFSLAIDDWQAGLYFYTFINDKKQQISGKWMKR